MKNAEYQEIFSSVEIGSITLKNRLLMTAMSTRLAGPGGKVSGDLIEYYARRAAGGTAMITVEEAYIHPQLPHVDNALGLFGDHLLPGLKKLTSRIHDEGALCSIQVGHYFREGVNGFPRYVASKQGGDAGPNDLELNTEEIAYLVGLFARASLRTKQAGFDAVEVHACHGCIISEFLSPFWNKRTDQYGGGREGRFRFALEILAAIRQAVGPDFPVIYRISASEFDEEGFSEEDGIALSRALEQGGADAINISGGLGHKNHIAISPYFVPKGILLPLGERIKQKVSVPVIVANGITPKTAAEAIKNGQADVIGLGRPLISDPDWPQKVAEGRTQNIRPCLRCNQGCFGGLRDPKIGSVTCLCNPQAGRELKRRLAPAQTSKKIVVAGGGPAGCEAARVAALRGHRVVLIEKSKHLGGQINLAAVPSGKSDFNGLPVFYADELERLGVEVRMGTEADMDLINSLEPDAVILALGSTPSRPPIPGSGLPHVVTAHQVLQGACDIPASGPAVVIGGGVTGLETAEYLAEKGLELTVIEMLDAVGRDIMQGLGIREGLLQNLADRGVKILTGHRAQLISTNSVTASDRPLTGGGNEIEIPAGLVVLSLGNRPNDIPDTADQASGRNWYRVGDCQNPGNAMAAIHAAFDLAATI